jgi:hypothetical protein
MKYPCTGTVHGMAVWYDKICRDHELDVSLAEQPGRRLYDEGGKLGEISRYPWAIMHGGSRYRYAGRAMSIIRRMRNKHFGTAPVSSRSVGIYRTIAMGSSRSPTLNHAMSRKRREHASPIIHRLRCSTRHIPSANGQEMTKKFTAGLQGPHPVGSGTEDLAPRDG